MGCNFGVEFSKVYHPALHRADAVLDQFGGLGAEVSLEIAHVAANQDGTVVQVVVPALAKGVAAEFAPVGQYIVAAAEFGPDAEGCHSLLQHRELAL